MNAFTLTITMDEAGNVKVDGPITQKVLVYGMLEAARDAIKDLHDSANADAPRVQVVPASALKLG